MRIAVVNWTNRKVGGVENYLNAVLPALAQHGHEIALWHEIEAPADREPIALPEGARRWCAVELGAERTLAALRDWRPDLIYAHGLLDPTLEQIVVSIAPGIFFAHSYYGTCISGGKSFQRPQVTPCDRQFGWRCLMHYYPHRCGGLNPVTMFREYGVQSARLKLLRRYRALATLSEHMRAEYLRHGFAPERVTTLPYYATWEPHQATARSLAMVDDRPHIPWRLLFPGRMELLKGGWTLLEALPLVRSALPNRPLQATFAGDGRDCAAWEREARQLQAACPGITVEFTGWVGSDKMDELYSACDLVVVPSLWPEPFGQVGPEAARRGVPVAAFAVGGIPEWLTDGVNGHLAPGNPPTAAGLAAAIVKCLRDPLMHARLREGAVEVAARFNQESHLAALQRLFQDVFRDDANDGRPGGLRDLARSAADR